MYKESGIERPAKLFRFPHFDKGGGKSFSKGSSLERIHFSNNIQNCLRVLDYKQSRFENINYKWYRKKFLHEDTDICCTFDVIEWTTFLETPLGVKKGEDILSRIDRYFSGNKNNISNDSFSNEIILIHDHPETTSLFYEIIEKILDKNLEFKLPNF